MGWREGGERARRKRIEYEGLMRGCVPLGDCCVVAGHVCGLRKASGCVR